MYVSPLIRRARWMSFGMMVVEWSTGKTLASILCLSIVDAGNKMILIFIIRRVLRFEGDAEVVLPKFRHAGL